MIPRELEHLESLVRLAKRKKDSEATKNQVSMVSVAPTLRKICINKTHQSKTLHLLVEINNYAVEGLVDTRASMSIMVIAVVRELGIMHLVTGSETYKIALGVVTHAFGRIDKVPVKVGGVQCTMTFMVVDTDSYDVLFGLDILINIGAIMDVERGLIQVWHGPRANVEVLPLTMVNLLQRMNSNTLMRKATSFLKNTHINDDSDLTNWILDQGSLVITKGEDASASNSDTGINSNEHYDGELRQFEQIDDGNEFRDTEREDLVRSEGPQ